RRGRDRGGAPHARAVPCNARPDGRPEWAPRGFPADGFPLATTVLLAVWALAILYLARGREAAEAAGRQNLRRFVVGAYVTLALVAAWTAGWLHLSVLRHEAAAEHDPRALRAIAGRFCAH